MGGVKFHEIETRRPGARRGRAEGLHQRLDFCHGERPRQFVQQRAGNGRRRHRLGTGDFPAGLATGVKQLDAGEHALCMHQLGSGTQPGDHGIRMQTELVAEAAALRSHKTSLENHRADTAARNARYMVQIARAHPALLVRVVAHHRGHQHAVLDRELADPPRPE